MEKLEQEEQNQLAGLAGKLNELQKDKNGGRGISCVKTLIFYLNQGDIQNAKAICWNESDKIVNYPDIRKLLQQELFSGDEDKDTPPHFRTSSDELYGKE